MLRHISLAALLALPLLLGGCFGEAKVTGGKEEAKTGGTTTVAEVPKGTAG